MSALRRPRPDALAAWIRGQRWFAAKTRRIEAVGWDDWIPLAGAGIALVSVRLDDGGVHRYAIPLAGPPAGEVTDAFADAGFCRVLLESVVRRVRLRSEGGGTLQGDTTTEFAGRPPAPSEVRVLAGEQSNTSVVFGEHNILKFFRRLTTGINPEREITQFLTERTPFAHSPRLLGALEYRGPDGGESTLAVLQEFVAGGRDGWRWTLEQVGELYDRARGSGPGADVDRARAWARTSLAALRRLGELTAALHRALGSRSDDPAFAPETITADDVAAWAAAVRGQVEQARHLLGDDARLAEVPGVAARLAALVGWQKIRHHGDFHLGQTLYRDRLGDFVILDFEGEPLRPLAERRRKHTPLRDVAGMLRSIDYAATFAPGRSADLEPWADVWAAEASRQFLAGYREGSGPADFLPASEDDFRWAVAVFELEKAAYEVVYEANHRPQWMAVPARGLLRAAARLGSPSAAAEG